METLSASRPSLSVIALSAACLYLSAPSGAQSELPASEAGLLTLLNADPSNAGARLQLGRMYYDQRRDRAADFQLRQARAQARDPEIALEARELLERLQRRRWWILRGDFAVAPQTSRSITESDDESEPDLTREVDSGVGLIANASIENRLPLSRSMRWSTQISGRALDYQGAQFDAMSVTALTGPLRLQRGDNLWSVRPLAQRSWRGGEVEFDAYGGEFAIQRSVADNVRAFARLNGRQVDYETNNARDGVHTSADTTVTHYGTNGGLERVFARVFRAEAEAENQQFWFSRAGVGAYRETFAGIGVYLEPFVSLQEFDGVDPEAGVGRRNFGYGGRARLVKQDWRALFNAAPYVQFSSRKVESNVSADTQDNAIEFGLTQTF